MESSKYISTTKVTTDKFKHTNTHQQKEKGISQILYSRSGCVPCRHLFPYPWVLIKWCEDPSAVQAAWIHSRRATDEQPWVFIPHCVRIGLHVYRCLSVFKCEFAFASVTREGQLFVSFSCVNMLFVLIFVFEWVGIWACAHEGKATAAVIVHLAVSLGMGFVIYGYGHSLRAN